jgi:ribonuclease HI
MMLVMATDGACPGNPGPGGWAWVTADGRSDSGGEPAPSTNNRMELMAVEQALSAFPDDDVLIQTDSRLVVDTFTEWLPDWISNGMMTGSGSPVANASLILRIDRLTKGRTVEWQHVRGHRGHTLNEQADLLAVAAAARFADARVEPDTFQCSSCFLTVPTTRRASAEPALCADCA